MKFNSALSALLVAVVCAGVAVSSFAQTGEVYSLNVVGFQKVTAPSNGLMLASSPFDPNDPGINKVIGPQMTPGGSYGVGDNIIMWAAASQGYKNFYLRTIGGSNQWIDVNVSPNIVATNAFIDPGVGFWVRNRHASNQVIVVSGDVVNQATMSKTVVPGLQILSYPYSTAIGLNSCGLTNGKPTTSFGTADNVIMWDAATQTYKNYYLRTMSGTNKWIDVNVSPNVIASNDIPSGSAFWYRSRGAASFTWVASKPYTL